MLASMSTPLAGSPPRPRNWPVALLGISAFMLLAALFVPLQTPDWTALKMASGYPVAQGWLGGPSVAIFHLAPHGAGLFILLALFMGRRRPLAGSLSLIVYGAVWLVTAAVVSLAVLRQPGLRYPALWLALDLAALILPVLAGLLCLRRLSSLKGLRILAGLFGLGVIAQLATLMGFARLEDDAGLGWGAPLALLGAVGLLIGLSLNARQAPV
jgi:hypothetical protein